MDDREKLRLKLTRDVLRLLRSSDFRDAFPPFEPGDEVPVLVAFRDDTLGTILHKIVRLGGGSHVFVPPEDLELWPAKMAFMRFSLGPVAERPGSMDGDDCQVDEGSHLGMLMKLMEMHGRRMTIHISRRESTVQLVDNGKDLAPA